MLHSVQHARVLDPAHALVYRPNHLATLLLLFSSRGAHTLLRHVEKGAGTATEQRNERLYHQQSEIRSTLFKHEIRTERSDSHEVKQIRMFECYNVSNKCW